MTNVLKTHKFQYIIGGIFILICVALLIYFLFFRGSSSSTSPTSPKCDSPKVLCGTDCCNQCSTTDPGSCSYCNSTDLTECVNSDNIVTCCNKNNTCSCIGGTTASCPDKNTNQCCPTTNLIPFGKSISGTNECCSVSAVNADGSGICIDNNGKYLCCPQGSTTNQGICSCQTTCSPGYTQCGGASCYDDTIFCCDKTDPKTPTPFCKQVGEACDVTKKSGLNVCGTQCCQGACDGNYCSQCNIADANPCQVNDNNPPKVDCCYGGQTCLCTGGQAEDTPTQCFAGENTQQCCDNGNVILSQFKAKNGLTYKSSTGLNECCPYNLYNADGTTVRCTYLDPSDNINVANCCETCSSYGRCDDNCNRSSGLVSCEGMCWDNKIFACTNNNLTCVDAKTEVCSNNKNSGGQSVPPTVTNCCLIGACELDANKLQTGNCLACDPSEFTQCPITSPSGAQSYNCCLTSETDCMCTGTTAQCSNSICCPKNNIITFDKTVNDSTCEKGYNCCCPWVPVDGDKDGNTMLCCPNGVDTSTTPWSCNTCGAGYFPCAGKCWDATQFTTPCTTTGNDPGPVCKTSGNTRCGTTCCPGSCNPDPSQGCAVSGCTDPSKVCDAGQRNACCAPDETCACVGGKIGGGACSNPSGNTCCNVLNYISSTKYTDYLTDVCCPVPVFNADGTIRFPGPDGSPLCCPNGYNSELKQCGNTCGDFSKYPDNTSNYDPQVCVDTQGCVLDTVKSGATIPPHNPPYCTPEQIANGNCQSGNCFSASCNWGNTTIYPDPQSWIMSRQCDTAPLYINECNNETTPPKYDCTTFSNISSRPAYTECDIICGTALVPADSTHSDYVRYSYVKGTSDCKEMDCLKKMQEFGFENYYFDTTTFECVAMAKPSGTCPGTPGKSYICSNEHCDPFNKLPHTLTPKETVCPDPKNSNCTILENLQETNCPDKSKNCFTDPYLPPTS